MIAKKKLNKIHDYLWEIPKSFRNDMRMPARVYATERMLDEIYRDKSLEQLVNVATLPGIERYALAMPDAHEGYGFPIGGVAAFDKETGVISPGGIGYDINCGVRLLMSERRAEEIKPRLKELARTLFQEIPSGVGRGGQLTLKGKDFDEILEKGAKTMIEMGYGAPEDLGRIESEGTLENADSRLVSITAKARGKDQLGTLGAGNHFVEVEEVEKIFDETEARAMRLFKGQTVILIHTGSRGLGHQIATDYIRIMTRAVSQYGISLPDRELACAPFLSPEGQDYFRAMSCGANFAWANRQMITWETREAWEKTFGQAGGKLSILYDVAHNIAKLETYRSADNQEKEFVVHRKGATRAFPEQVVIIPGSMGTGSYILVGQKKSLDESFGSTCHGAGRRMSRAKAKQTIRGTELRQRLQKEGIAVEAGSLASLAEEAPEAYKDVDEVVEIVHQAGIAKKVARLKPLAVIKG